jgi:hypothetical protein
MPSSRMPKASDNVRALMAVIGGSALVAMGAVAVTVAQEAPTATAVVGPAPTTTSTIPPSTPEVAFAKPTVTATFFGKH